MKIIDLSVPIVHGLPVDPPPQIVQIEYITHRTGADSMLSFFPAQSRQTYRKAVAGLWKTYG